MNKDLINLRDFVNNEKRLYEKQNKFFKQMFAFWLILWYYIYVKTCNLIQDKYLFYRFPF